jgi:hypothetical protein
MADLKPRQTKAAALLVMGRTARDVAREINCTPETISIWRRDPEFQRLVLELKAEAMVVCRGMISSAVLDAANTLVSLVREGRSEEVRRRAALDVLDLAGVRHEDGALTRRSFEEEQLGRLQDLEQERQNHWLLAQLRACQPARGCAEVGL